MDAAEPLRRETHPQVPVLNPAAHLPSPRFQEEIASKQGDSGSRVHVRDVPWAQLWGTRDVRSRRPEALQIAPGSCGVAVGVKRVRKQACGTRHEDVVRRKRHHVGCRSLLEASRPSRRRARVLLAKYTNSLGLELAQNIQRPRIGRAVVDNNELDSLLPTQRFDRLPDGRTVVVTGDEDRHTWLARLTVGHLPSSIER